MSMAASEERAASEAGESTLASDGRRRTEPVPGEQKISVRGPEFEASGQEPPTMLTKLDEEPANGRAQLLAAQQR